MKYDISLIVRMALLVAGVSAVVFGLICVVMK